MPKPLTFDTMADPEESGTGTTTIASPGEVPATQADTPPDEEEKSGGQEDEREKTVLAFINDIEVNLRTTRRLAFDLPIAMDGLRTLAKQKLGEGGEFMWLDVILRLLDIVLQAPDLSLRSRIEHLVEELKEHPPNSLDPKKLEGQIVQIICRLPS